MHHHSEMSFLIISDKVRRYFFSWLTPTEGSPNSGLVKARVNFFQAAGAALTLVLPWQLADEEVSGISGASMNGDFGSWMLLALRSSPGGRAKACSKLASMAISTFPAESFWKRAKPTESSSRESVKLSPSIWKKSIVINSSIDHKRETFPVLYIPAFLIKIDASYHSSQQDKSSEYGRQIGRYKMQFLWSEVMSGSMWKTRFDQLQFHNSIKIAAIFIWGMCTIISVVNSSSNICWFEVVV